ncbi:MAG: protein translocase subunit SecD, partial [bacterium]|nr:protein translocase subunit SecD [bacterium]
MGLFPKPVQSSLAAPKKRRWIYLLICVISAALFFGFLNYPLAWDKSVDYINWKLNLENYKLPHIWKIPFRLGLDLQGGTHLVYQADLAELQETDPASAMEGLRDVIERRIDLFGVTEPLVGVNKAGDDWRLIVELAGIRDVAEAIKMIGETPFLEFKEERDAGERDLILEKTLGREDADKLKEVICLNPQILIAYLQSYPSAVLDPCFIQTPLNGKYLKNSSLDFDPTTYKPVVNLEFNEEGTKMFADITERNTGKFLAIYLDGAPIEIPRVNERIPSGRAQISGGFTTEAAKKLVERLNAGALPVPIKLISQRTVGAALGADSLAKSVKAGILGFLLVAIFMIVFYRLPGIFAVSALLIYVSVVLIVFKTIPVTLTLAGIAGFILSIGMAVDANILIFERMKEELRSGRHLVSAIDEGFSRAWPSIRDSNISTIITSVILYYFTTSFIKGFALALLIGVLVSMFSAIT